MSDQNLQQAEQLLRLTPGKKYASTLIFWMIVGNLPLLLIVFFLYDALASTFHRAPTAVLALAASIVWLLMSYFVIARLLEPLKYMSSLLQFHEKQDRKLPDLQFTTQHEAGIMLNNLHSLIRREQLLRNWLNELTPEEHLTGFYSHDWTETRLEEDITRAKRDEGKLTLLLLEISNYSTIREQAGLSVADNCLLTLAKLAGNNTRKGDWLSRWRENQILVALWNDQDKAVLISQRILDTFSSVKFVDDSNNTIQVLPRIIHCPYNGTDTTKVLIAKIQSCLEQNATANGKVITCTDEILQSRI